MGELASTRGWGSGWPNCQPGNIRKVSWTQPQGTPLTIPVHLEMAALVPELINRLATARGEDYAQYGTWGYSCLAGETLVMTPDGDVPIRDLAGTTATLLTRMPNGNGARASWVQAPVRSYGIQPIMRVVLSRHGRTREVYATPEHRWILSTGDWSSNGSRGYTDAECATMQLTPGTPLASCWTHSVAARTVPSSLGVAHGLVTGDGTIYRRFDRDGRGEGRLALYGAKNWPLVIDAHRERWTSTSGKRRPRWKVISVEATDRVEEVFCAEVPDTECFALSDYLLTGNCRAIGDTNVPSNHSWGLAVDLEAPSNPHFSYTYGTQPHNAGAIARDLMFRWGGPTGLGGGYVDSYDCMHYEFMGTVAQARFLSAQLQPHHHPFEQDWAWMARAYSESFLYRVWSDSDIYAYCRANNIDQLTGVDSTGRVMRPTLRPGKLNPDSPLWPHIVFLQNILNLHPELKFLTLTPNGDFNDDTEIAVKRRQTAFGLPANGIVDVRTWGYLGQSWAGR